MLAGMWKNLEPSYIADGSAELFSPFRKLASFRKLNIYLLYFDPTVALLGIYPRGIKNVHTDLSMNVHNSIIVIAKDWEKIQMSKKTKCGIFTQSVNRPVIFIHVVVCISNSFFCV